ncbi:MAG: AMP-binding protein [Lachnospiraceae bacterium]|nr:AMP-binding protein [Lachnospiraceae bacterium]
MKRDSLFDFAIFGPKIALFADNQLYTYADLRYASDHIAAAIGRRCLIFILCSNSPGIVAAYAGCINRGIVPVLLDANLDPALLKRLSEKYAPAYYIAPTELVMDREDEFDDCSVLMEQWNVLLLKRNIKHEYPLSDELALLLNTSGSTGSPKLVRLSYENIKSNTQSIINFLEITRDERAITTLPFSYSYGLSIINTHLYSGAGIVLTDLSPFEDEFWRLFNIKECTNFSGVPYTYERLEKTGFFKRNLPTLKTMTQAGGRIPDLTHQHFAEYAKVKRKRFIVMYGASEATARMAYLPSEDALEKIGSMGIAIPGGRFQIVTSDGAVIEKPDEVGELIYEGKNVAMGYATKGEDLILPDLYHGILSTGDMARMDKDGYFYIEGRMTRFLKVHEKRINLDEVEELIKNELSIYEIACTGSDDNMKLFTTDETYAKQIFSYLADRMGISTDAFEVCVIPRIPKNNAGKIQYKELNGK